MSRNRRKFKTRHLIAQWVRFLSSLPESDHEIVLDAIRRVGDARSLYAGEAIRAEDAISLVTGQKIPPLRKMLQDIPVELQSVPEMIRSLKEHLLELATDELVEADPKPPWAHLFRPPFV